MNSPNLLTCIGAVAVAIAIGAIVEAANRPSGKSCQHEARSLGYNLNDEQDIPQADKYIAKCQQAERVAQQRPIANNLDRRALAQAEPKYQAYGVPMFEQCRDRATSLAWNFRDELDIGQANKHMQNCMSGKIR